MRTDFMKFLHHLLLFLPVFAFVHAEMKNFIMNKKRQNYGKLINLLQTNEWKKISVLTTDGSDGIRITLTFE